MKIEIIPTKGWLYDKCENMEQLYDKYYYPLLVENAELKKQLEELERGKWVKETRKQIENKLIENIDNIETLSIILNYLDSLYLSIDSQLCKIKEYKTQQQEFIKYMGDKIKYFKDLEQFAIKTFNNKAVINLDLVKISIDEDRIVIENLEDILQRYKETIGRNEDESEK